MDILWILLGAAAGIVVLVLLISLICFYMAFYASRRAPKNLPEFNIPSGKSYAPFREMMIGWMKSMRATPYQDITITSFDGLKLHGRYYEYAPGATLELMFHGYRSTAERDLCGGIQRCFDLGRSALIVDQRAAGLSEGHVISFGINERRDCMAWVNYIVENFPKDQKIILCGISMGAATVMMASEMALPENVVGILADCGYTSARDIIKKVIRQMHLPAGLLYPFVKLGAKLYGRFDLEETSPIEAMKHCRVPALFVHGETDNFVPCEMSRLNYEACAAKKKLVTIPDADHGLAYPVAQEKYLHVLAKFWTECGVPTEVVAGEK